MSARNLVAVFSAAVALTAAANAQAASNLAETEQVSVRVSLADLDLHKDAGANVALRRIRTAAKTVCGNESQLSGLNRYIPYVACVRSTVSVARGDLETQVAQNTHAPIVLSRR